MKQTLLPHIGAALVAVAALGSVMPPSVRAAHPASAAGNPTVPFLINYQGTLQDGAGNPIATGDYELSFSIYSAASGGALLWGPQKFNGQSGTGLGPRVPVVNGRFNVVLGPVDTGNHPLVDIFNQSATYVEITVGAGAPIAPRQRILPTAYAFDSATLNGFTWESLFSGGNPETGTLALGLDPTSVVPFSDAGVPRADISGRIRLRQGGAGSAGMWFRQDSTASDLAFMGMNGDNGVGFYSPSGPGWGLSMNLASGKVSVPGGVSVGSGGNSGINYGQWSDRVIVIGGASRSYTNRLYTDVRGTLLFQSFPLVLDAPEKLEVYTPTAVFSGTIQSAGFGPVSDQRLKKEVERIHDPMDILNRIDGVTYKFDKEGEFARQSGFQLPDGRQVGVIAQAVEKALPEAVIKSPNGVLGVNYNGLTGVLIEALKQQQQQIQQLQSQLRVLQEKQRQ
jgi:hypothetical protein